MKQILKKLSFVLMSLIFSICSFSIVVNAEDTIRYPEIQTFYMAEVKRHLLMQVFLFSGFQIKRVFPNPLLN